MPHSINRRYGNARTRHIQLLLVRNSELLELCPPQLHCNKLFLTARDEVALMPIGMSATTESVACPPMQAGTIHMYIST
jgi:hypothetical protein